MITGGEGARNVRAHLLRSSQRITALVVVDVLAAGIVALTIGLLSGLPFGALAAWIQPVLAVASVPALQLAGGLLLGMAFVRGYQGGDRWKDATRVSGASGAAVAIALYGSLWVGNLAAVMGAGVLLWVLLGTSLVICRGVLAWSIGFLPPTRWDHRVLEIIGEESGPLGSSLGPGYRRVATLSFRDLPADVDGMNRWLRGGVDTILISGQIPSEHFGGIIDLALTHGCRLLSAPRSLQVLRVDARHVSLNGRTYSDLTTPSLRASQMVLKRAVDIVGSVLLLVLLSPLLVALAIWVRLDSPGRALFRQERPGLRGRPFGIFKFRSMRVDAEKFLHSDPRLYERFLANGCKLPEAEDPRITWSGRFMRKTSLDELPQLLNVLVGSMSLVGPRPLVGPEIDHYRDRTGALFSVKPGMTGLWQISGRSSVGFPIRAEMDLDYVRNWSFLRDVWILLMTVPAVVFRHGAH